MTTEKSLIGQKINLNIEVNPWDKPEEIVKLNSAWDHQKVLFKIFRRFGCPLCRLEAKVLSNYKKEFEKLNVRVIGIGFDELGLKEWTENKFWDYELYMDKPRTLYKYLNFNRHNYWSGIVTLFGDEEQRASRACKERGITGNMLVGDGFQLGGTYLLDQGGEILYEFKQKGYGDYPSLKEVIFAAGGDPNIIDHKDEVLVRHCNDAQCQI
ncbi:hypothetical protein K502DRAFT_340274 [Neoconidiobolus thromboides FSU 785]|nr:hypothetical protein K502DRAFT_340274 [Neoconidiobolus thromboides FSU 785]